MFDLELRELLMIGGGALLGVAILAMGVRSLFRGGRRKGPGVKTVNLAEDLYDYPDPPPHPGGARLFVDGVPARLRLVVVVPTGTQQASIDVDEIPELLNGVIRGLGGCVATDKPRLRVWPPQLSVTGFPPSFFRNVPSPHDDAAMSGWVRLAGLVKARGRPFLLGLALLTDDDTDIGALALEPNEWVHHLAFGR